MISKKPQSISVDIETWEKFRQKCYDEKTTPSKKTTELIKEFLEKEGKKNETKKN